MLNINSVIEKAYKNNKKISIDDIDKMELSQDEYEILISTLKNYDIIIETIDEMEERQESDIGNYDCDSIKEYLNQIGKMPLLTLEQEYELGKRIKTGDKLAKQKLIESNLRLVVNIAKKYIYTGVAFDDIIQDGNTGLMRAVESYDVDKGFRFTTYAYWWIRQAITRSLSSTSRIIRIPSHITEKSLKIKKYETQFFNENGRIPTRKELQKHFNFSEQMAYAYNFFNQNIISLETPVGDEQEITLADFIQDDIDVESVVTNKIQVQNLVEVMKLRLNENEITVVVNRYGVFDGNPKTLEEVGKLMGVTRERVRQIEMKALKKLRNYYDIYDKSNNEKEMNKTLF